MHNFIQVPEGTTLLDLLGAKRELPSIGKKSHICASCFKPFNASRRIAGHLRTTSAELFIPVIFIYPLCRGCAEQLKQGGKKEDAVLAAVEKFINGEVSQ
ncbi:hypothetical protein SAMN06298226_2555 [Nitrosovibrio sp. Nv4]|nr:hypothetical protein SAMN06298226_2555 [Nitrosovibrio sp. Nv4]